MASRCAQGSRCSRAACSTTRSSRRSARRRARHSIRQRPSRNGTRCCWHRPTGWSGRRLMMERRDLLKLMIAGGVAAVGGPFSFASRAYAYATNGASDTRFLLVFLRGGYDAANVVIPVGSSFYYDSRPTLAIKKPNADDPEAALALARPGEAVEWALHPALKDTIYPFWQKGQAAFVPFAG